MEWLTKYEKPVIIDECGYEGTVEKAWGNLTAEELVHRMWNGFIHGAPVGHGETYWTPEEVLWWSKGGMLRGESAERIGFLKKVFEEIPGDPVPLWDELETPTLHINTDYYLLYLGRTQSERWKLDLPTDAQYRIDILDVWNCTVTTLPRLYSRDQIFPLPGKPMIAVRLTKQKGDK